MSATVAAAILGAFASLAVGIIANFYAEDYRRWRDGAGTAAALAGELASYETAEPLLRRMFSGWAHMTARGDREQLIFRKFEKPTDVIFDAMIARIGLLEPELIGQVAYVYGNLKGMRGAMMVVMEEHATMSDDELLGRANACIDALNRVFEHGKPLVVSLESRARTPWRPWPLRRTASAKP